MTTVALLAECRRRSVALFVQGDRLRYRGPEEALTPDLKGELAAHKASIVELLRQDERRRQYATLTADIATDEDCEALRWLTEHGHDGLVGELLALDNRCAELALVGAPEGQFRAAVEVFVNRVREMRQVYRERRQRGE